MIKYTHVKYLQHNGSKKFQRINEGSQTLIKSTNTSLIHSCSHVVK